MLKLIYDMTHLPPFFSFFPFLSSVEPPLFAITNFTKLSKASFTLVFVFALVSMKGHSNFAASSWPLIESTFRSSSKSALFPIKRKGTYK